MLRAFCIVILVFLGGCCVPASTICTHGGAEAGKEIDRAPEPQRIDALTQELSDLSPRIRHDEARSRADVAVHYTTFEAEKYDFFSLAEMNSLMVNLGIKPRGQCFQLADDLKVQLVEKKFKTLVFTRAIAHKDELFREHNCLVVTAPGQPFEQGLVLDPWRNPGVLRWARVQNDVYPWVPRIVGKPKTSTTRPVELSAR